MAWYRGVVGALVVMAAGCGSGYREDANGICRALQADVEGLPVPRQPRNLGRYLQMNLELARAAHRRFNALEPPGDLADEHRHLERLNARGEEALGRLARRVGRSRAPGETLRRSFRDLEPLVAESNRTARRAGLDDCIEELPGADPPGTSKA